MARSWEFDFWSLGIDASTHYLSQKYSFKFMTGMAGGWEFIIPGLWVLTHSPYGKKIFVI